MHVRYLERGARYPAERREVLHERCEVLDERFEVLKLPGYSYRASCRYRGGTCSWVLARRRYLQLVSEVLQLRDEASAARYRMEACTYTLPQSTSRIRDSSSHNYMAMM